MNPKEFSQVADVMRALSGPFPEGRERSAISRYYYAVFLEARERLFAERGWKFKPHEAHENVKRCFSFSNERELLLIGSLLGDLKKLRVEADYDLAKRDPQAGNEAKRIQDDIEEALAKADFSKCVNPLGKP